MGFFDLFVKKSTSSANKCAPCYRLQILFVTKDWSSAQDREFVAVDIQKRQFYRVYEQLGAWMASYYFVKAIEKDDVNRLFRADLPWALKNARELIPDWASLTAALQDEKIIEITQQILLPRCKM